VSLDEDSWRTILEHVTSVYVDTVATIKPEQWDAPALGVWSVRDLVGHASRALLTIELYVARDAEMITLDSAVAYLSATTTSIDRNQRDQAIAERGRQAGTALGSDPASSVRAIADRVLALVDRTASDAPCATPAGGIELGSYLPTRAFELTIHTLDILEAIDAPVPSELREPVAASLALLSSAIGQSDVASSVLLALTGRRALPASLGLV
jgi:hypothetical protein